MEDINKKVSKTITEDINKEINREVNNKKKKKKFILLEVNNFKILHNKIYNEINPFLVAKKIQKLLNNTYNINNNKISIGELLEDIIIKKFYYFGKTIEDKKEYTINNKLAKFNKKHIITKWKDGDNIYIKKEYKDYEPIFMPSK